MTEDEKKVTRYLIANPNSRLTQICLGTGLNVPRIDSALNALISRGIAAQFFGGVNAEYHIPRGKEIFEQVLGNAFDELR